MAERIRGAIENGHFRGDAGAEVAVTLSAGVVEAHPGQRVADLLDAVDRLLCEAKGTRNRVAGDPASARAGA